MEGDALEDILALLPPLLNSLRALGFVGRYLNPPDLEGVLQAIGAPDEGLRRERPRLESWPENLIGARIALGDASDETIAAFDGLRSALDQPQPVLAVYRALGHLTRAQEALYPLAANVPPINRYFLEAEAAEDEALQQRTLDIEPRQDTGVFHVGDGPGARGGFSMYVPEYYSPDRAWPLVVALHGGSGNGRGFLWSWLRAARTHGAILVAPTASGETWALQTKDVDSPLLARIVDGVSGRWNVDPGRRLLTGMSDGGTFSYLSGMRSGSPFTHLAPVSAAFHPFMVEIADAERIAGLPMFITHGTLDWMFAIDTARMAEKVLSRAGAQVTFREIEDLSHTYPREINMPILDWLADQPAATPDAAAS